MTQSKQDELRNDVAVQTLEIASQAKYNMSYLLLDKPQQYELIAYASKPSKAIISLINSEVTAALEELEKDMQDPNNVEFYIESKNELLSSTEYIQILKEKYKSE